MNAPVRHDLFAQLERARVSDIPIAFFARDRWWAFRKVIQPGHVNPYEGIRA